MNRIKTTLIVHSLATLCLLWIMHANVVMAAEQSKAENGPKAISDLQLTAPIDRWDEAIPLGNGLMGGLLWGNGKNLKLSLDRADLWDLRTPETILRKDWTYATVQKLVAEKNQAKLVELFDMPYTGTSYPTKIPAGRLELTLHGSQTSESFSLDLASAVARVKVRDGGVEAFYSAEEPVAMLRIKGAQPTWRIVPPASLKQLGYDPPQTGSDGETSWSLQEAALELEYALVVAGRRVGDTTEIAIAITSTRDDPDPLALGRKLTRAALNKGYEQMLRPHVGWWQRFWSKSCVRVPDQDVQQHYDLVQYFYGATSRRGTPPITLQGVWTADEESLPPWHGDYHHDLNTQMSYWAYLCAGHFDQGASFLDFMWDLLPRHRKFAKSFYDAPGAAVPGVMTLDGKPMGGWAHYSLSPTMGAWVAQSFYLHWRYTMDREFLTERAYPYCSAIAECLETLLKPGADGKLKLPLSTSPEIHDNRLKAWLTPNSNNDLSLLRWLFGALVEMAGATGDGTAAEHWQAVLEKLDDLAVEGEAGPLRLSPDESLAESHRHHAHLMPIYPMGILHVEGSERDRKIITASLEQLDRLGTKNWVGFGFTWLACIAARVGDAQLAEENLDIFLKAFISRNGFNLNGDYKQLGYSGLAYRPFTLETNFAAGQAVHEMLLQSWDGVVRVFPAVPEKWADVRFENLRAEGGFGVWARRESGSTTWVRVRSEHGGLLRLRDPFAGKQVSWNRADVKKTGKNYQCTLRPGEVLEGRLRL